MVGNQVVGMAGIDAVGACHKVSHRAEFGICLVKEYWGLGLGKAMTKSLYHAPKEAGYAQLLELNVVADNQSAIRLYKKWDLNMDAIPVESEPDLYAPRSGG